MKVHSAFEWRKGWQTRCGLSLESFGTDTFTRRFTGNIILIAGKSGGCPEVTCERCKRGM